MPEAHILIVDDEKDHAQVMSEALTRVGHSCDVAYSLAEAQKRLDKSAYDVVVTDLMMDGKRDGLELLKEVHAATPATPVLLVTAVNDVPTSREAIREGAYDYIVKPLDLEDFRAQVNRAVEKAALQRDNEVLVAHVMETSGFEGIIGKSGAMQKVVQTARQVAASDIPVLILGESGTGKELIAKAIHNNSRRRKNQLVALNCAGLPESTIEDELFGHVRGAFTNAMSDREGRFEYANKGSLFLDEIGDMPLSMQAKLLRVLEMGEVVRLGSNAPRKVDVRIISATNRIIEEMVAEKSFREDRREDITLLSYYFLKQSAEKNGKQIEGFAPDVQQTLMNYSWPGNVRQLKNAIELMVVLSSETTITADLLPSEIRPTAARATVSSLAGLTQEAVEREHIKQTLTMTGGNRENAAKLLGMGERTLYRKIKDYGLGE